MSQNHLGTLWMLSSWMPIQEQLSENTRWDGFLTLPEDRSIWFQCACILNRECALSNPYLENYGSWQKTRNVNKIWLGAPHIIPLIPFKILKRWMLFITMTCFRLILLTHLQLYVLFWQNKGEFYTVLFSWILISKACKVYYI